MSEQPVLDPIPAYAVSETRPRRIKRVKLALLLSSLTACIGVSIVGLVMMGLMFLFTGISGAANESLSQANFLGGVLLAFQYSALNFFLFLLTVPAAALALGFSIARFPRRGITRLPPYLRWGAIWGAILVGSVAGSVSFAFSPAAALGALFGGTLVGSMAGLFCGFLFHAIVRPAQQIAEADISVF